MRQEQRTASSLLPRSLSDFEVLYACLELGLTVALGVEEIQVSICRFAKWRGSRGSPGKEKRLVLDNGWCGE